MYHAQTLNRSHTNRKNNIKQKKQSHLINFSILSLKHCHCFLNNVHLQSSICVTEFESCQIFRGDVWLTLVTYQQTCSSNWTKISLLSFHGSLPWFQRCRALSASGLFQKPLLLDSTCYFHAEQEEKQEGDVHPSKQTQTHTHLLLQPGVSYSVLTGTTIQQKEGEWKKGLC